MAEKRETDIIIGDNELLVKYDYTPGLPATRDDPEEPEDYEITSIVDLESGMELRDLLDSFAELLNPDNRNPAATVNCVIRDLIIEAEREAEKHAADNYDGPIGYFEGD